MTPSLSDLSNVFVTGTDTGVGKTYTTALLVRHLRARGFDAVGFKPICCGSREDAEILHAAADGALELNEVNPVWLRAPASPYAASLIESRSVDLALIHETYAALRACHRSVVVEGVGGWLVPIRRDYTVADLARDCGLPVVVVVLNRLGALNHTALTVRHIQSTGLTCAGLILNDGPAVPAHDAEAAAVATVTNGAILEEWLGVPILHTLTAGQQTL